MFSALDTHAHNEIAYEAQDACGGMPEPSGGVYHRHSLSDCMPHIHEKNALVGYALDGFGLFSPYDANGKELTTKDLDECHGITSEIMWDGKKVNMYHYVMTRDYPYSISCFKGTPVNIKLAPPPANLTYGGSPSSTTNQPMARTDSSATSSPSFWTKIWKAIASFFSSLHW